MRCKSSDIPQFETRSEGILMTVGSSVQSVERAPTSYDETPYPSQAFVQTHPDRLATIATLFNLKPQSIKNCRVLEIGCASGANIIPMAYTLPGSQFVGIDLSTRQLAAGQSRIDSMGLKNVELKHMNILEVDHSLGKFDYIIAHGIYSWVSNEIQDKLLKISQELLSPRGVAYISYNTFPGWHYRGLIRDMMLYHTAALTVPIERAQQARAILDFLAQSVPTENNAYGIMLKTEAEYLRALSDSYLLHDHLEDQNSPLYFYQFIERANSHGLQFLGEADFASMITGNFTREVDQTLRKISNDIVRTEQYMDFVRNRTFRQTLLCHTETVVNRNLGPLSVMPFYVGCPAKQAPTEADPSGQTFVTPTGVSFNTGSPVVKAAFTHLSKVWPHTVRFDELVKIARENAKTTANDDPEVLAGCVLTAFAGGICVLRTEPATFIREVTERPEASTLVRDQAKNQEWVTNQLHENLQVDLIARHMLQFLDGTRDKAKLADELYQLVQSGVLVVHKDGKILTEGEPLREAVAQSVSHYLAEFAKTAVLIA